MPSIRVAQAHAKGGGTTYFYRLDETAATSAHKGESYHSYDLGYVWETLSAAEASMVEQQPFEAELKLWDGFKFEESGGRD